MVAVLMIIAMLGSAGFVDVGLGYWCFTELTEVTG